MTPEQRAERLGQLADAREQILATIAELRVTDWPAYRYEGPPIHPSKGRPRWVMIWELEMRFPEMPKKVLWPALHLLQRAGEIDGCLCGCRGDLELPDHWTRTLAKSN